jgi:hypothetical protein
VLVNWVLERYKKKGVEGRVTKSAISREGGDEQELNRTKTVYWG